MFGYEGDINLGLFNFLDTLKIEWASSWATIYYHFSLFNDLKYIKIKNCKLINIYFVIHFTWIDFHW